MISPDTAEEPVSGTSGNRQSLRILYFTDGQFETGHAKNQGKMTDYYSGMIGAIPRFLVYFL